MIVGTTVMIVYDLLTFAQWRLTDVGIWPPDEWPDEDGEYTWTYGGEMLRLRNFEHRSQYHPNDALCEPEPFWDWENGDDRYDDGYLCHWCGRTVM